MVVQTVLSTVSGRATSTAHRIDLAAIKLPTYPITKFFRISSITVTCGKVCFPMDPVELEIFKNIFHSIAEEMGAALRRTAFSPNIKERRDYSCAVFDEAGEVIAMG